MTSFHRLVALITLLIAPIAASASPQRVSLGELQHMSAQIVVVGANGASMSYTPADLERMPTYALRTTTPWREEPAEFEGILLRDLLESHGLATVEAIQVTAENEYSVTIPRAVWEETDILVATRVDGRAHTRRARGPIQFVIDMDSYLRSDIIREDHMVWMAARIEPVR